MKGIFSRLLYIIYRLDLEEQEACSLVLSNRTNIYFSICISLTGMILGIMKILNPYINYPDEDGNITR
jgi:hypothetical protein